MNAFGKRNGASGMSGGRPSFGVARPMKGGAGGGSADVETTEEAEPAIAPPPENHGPAGGAMDRLLILYGIAFQVLHLGRRKKI